MRSFAVQARQPTPTTKISLGLTKDNSSKPGVKQAEQSVPSGLPLTTTRPVSRGTEVEATWATAKRGKEKVLEIGLSIRA